jgi:predicted ATPase
MKNNETMQTNWYVITGGPSSGKTTMINMLAEQGYKTTIEHARHYIDTMRVEGQTVEDLRSNKREFQLGVLKMQIEQEASLNPMDVVFLDRAIPDALAYYRFLGLEVDEILKKAMSHVNYKKVFILDKLPLVNDYARLESKDDQSQIQNIISEVYESLPFPVIHVPVLPPVERVDFILNNIKNN